MKRIVAILMLLVLCMGLCCGCQSEEEETVVEEPLTVVDEGYYQKFQGKDISINVYNWGEYIPDVSEEGVRNLNAEFTKLTGIKVNYTTYATNEELYAKLKGGGASYDIIFLANRMLWGYDGGIPSRRDHYETEDQCLGVCRHHL